MIKTANIERSSPQIDLDYSIAGSQLRLLRRKFLKFYSQKKGRLSAEDLSALLLYFALSFLQQENVFNRIESKFKLYNKTLNALTDTELALVGSQLLDLLQTVLPANLRQVMVVPNEVSWHQARLFFAEYKDDTIFGNISNLGFAYQIFSLGMQKQNALVAVQQANKTINREELIAFTQLYTPDWVVDFLIANTILPSFKGAIILKRYSQWLLAKGSDKRETDTALNNKEQQKSLFKLLDKFSVLDPACGAGQFLLSAFDLLLSLYRQSGCDDKEATELILSKNICGADIDEKALWVTGLGLLCRCLSMSNFAPGKLFNLHWLNADDIAENIVENTFLGSIDQRLPQEHILKKSYQVIVTNPPYLGRKCLSRDLKTTLKDQYPNSSSDLAAAFLERCGQMLTSGGRLGVITQASLISIPSYQGLRNCLFGNYAVAAIVRCGPGVFPLSSGEKIDSLLLLLSAHLADKKIEQNITCSIDLTEAIKKNDALVNIINDTIDGAKANLSVSFISQANLQERGSLSSGLSSGFYNKIAQLPKLGDIAEVRQGLATTDNARFVRYSFDVEQDSIGTIWAPYIKGSGSEKYVSRNPFVVKWENNGREIKEAVVQAYPYLKGKTAWVVKNEQYYFRPGLCFSLINKTDLSVRRLPAGSIFDVGSSAIFAKSEDEDFLLAYLNSKIIGLIVKAINQTINIQVGDLKKLPIFPFDQSIKERLTKLGQQAFVVKEKLLELQNIDFCDLPPGLLSTEILNLMFEKRKNHQQELLQNLNDLQRQIDIVVVEAIKKMHFIDSAEAGKLYKWLDTYPESKQQTNLVFDEKSFAYKLLLSMVSRVVSSGDYEKVVLIASANDNCFSRLFNLSLDAENWFEQKLGMCLERMFCQSTTVDISKLAQEPSCYFSVYMPEYNACMFFSASAVRHLQKSLLLNRLPIEDALKIAGGSNLVDPVLLKQIMQTWLFMFDQLTLISDWTSKDLFNKIHLLFQRHYESNYSLDQY